MAKESTIQDKVLTYLNGIRGCVAENVHGSMFTKGRPDINAVYKGRSLRIELKSPAHGNTPSELQKQNLKQWGKAGAIAFVAYSLEEVQYAIREDKIACLYPNACKSCPVKKKYCYCSFKDV